MRFHLTTIVLIAFFNILHSTPLQNKKVKLAFNVLTTKDGLSQGSIPSIAQDTNNFMWFATRNGLDRFDGYEFKVFKNIKEDSTSLPNNIITSIHVDKTGKLWVGTSKGLVTYNEKDESFTKIPIENRNNLSIGFIKEGPDSVLWFSTEHGLFYMDKISGKIKNFEVSNFDFDTLDAQILGFEIDSSNTLWMNSDRVYEFNIKEKKLIKNKLFEFSLIPENKDRYIKLVIDKNQDIWTTTHLSKTIRYSPKSNSIKLYTTPKDGVNSLVNSLYSDKHGTLWVAFDKIGLFQFDFKNDEFIEIINTNDVDILKSSTFDLFVDNQNNLWIGRHDFGLAYADLNHKAIKHIIHERDNPNGLNHNIVSCIYIDSDDKLWVGTDGGGINQFDEETNSFTHYQHEKNNPQSIADDAILTIFEDSKRRLWFGSFRGGLAFFDKKTKTFKNYMNVATDATSIHSNDVRSITEDKNGNLWLVTHGKGVAKFDIKNETFTPFVENALGNEYSMSSNWTFDVHEDEKGDIWVATSTGISIIDPASKKIRTIHADPLDSTSLSHDWVMVIFEDSHKNLWFGTTYGLNRYVEETNNFISYTTKDGLANNIINAIEEDADGYLWVSTMEGISRLDPQTASFINFDENDGLQGDQFFRNSSFKDKDGFLYFGGRNGLNIFHPKELNLNLTPPNIFITDIRLFNKSISKEDQNGSSIAPMYTSKLVFNHKQNFISFKYAALNFINTAKNSYAYTLEGATDDWTLVEDERKAVFAGLQPGEYIFRVKASNNNNIWNTEGTSIKITITPPWWDTLWFKFSVIFFIIAGGVAFYLTRIKLIKERNRILEHMVSKRTRELSMAYDNIKEQKEEIETQNHVLAENKEELLAINEQLKDANKTKDKFLSIIAHDLKNPISTLIGLSDLMFRNTHKYDLNKITNFSGVINNSSKQIYNLLENLLQWARSQTGKIKYSPDIYSIEELIIDPVSLLRDTALQKGVKISTKILGKEKVYADKFMIITTIRNLISNAIKFTPADGEITVETTRINNNFIKFSIKDTGQGMSPDKIETLFIISKNKSTHGTNGETGSGLGLIISNEFIKHHGSDITVESVINEGSSFSFEIPLYIEKNNMKETASKNGNIHSNV